VIRSSAKTVRCSTALSVLATFIISGDKTKLWFLALEDLARITHIVRSYPPSQKTTGLSVGLHLECFITFIWSGGEK
jgi:hypothetical protein